MKANPFDLDAQYLADRAHKSRGALAVAAAQAAEASLHLPITSIRMAAATMRDSI